MDGNVLGASPGQVSDQTSDTLSNNYATIADQSVDAIATRTLPRQVTTGTSRGTQTIVNTDGSYVTLGLIPDNSGDFGVAYFTADNRLVSKNTGVAEYTYDTDGSLLSKNTGSGNYLYDKTTGSVIIQTGQGDDGSNAFAVYDSSNTRRLMAGRFADGSIKMKLSQIGNDVGTAADDKLIWSSDFNSFKIVQSGILTLGAATITSSAPSRYDRVTVSATYNHNLGYIPTVEVYGLDSTASQRLAPNTELFVGPSGAAGWASTLVGVDATSLTISNQLLVGSTATNGLTISVVSAPYKFYLKRETAN